MLIQRINHYYYTNTNYSGFIWLIFCLCQMSCSPRDNPVITQNDLVSYTYNVNAVYPHDANAQTEGLEFADGYIYESTGPILDSGSSLRRIDLETGAILQIHQLGDSYFERVSQKSTIYFTKLRTRLVKVLFITPLVLNRSALSLMKQKAGDSQTMDIC